MKVEELKRYLELVKPGLGTQKGEFLEQISSIIFSDGMIRTFNDKVGIILEVETGIQGAVPGEPIYAFLNKLRADADLNISQDGNELKISSGRNRAGIRMDEQIKLPLDEELKEPDEWMQLPEKFIPALHSVMFSASSSGQKPILTCVHFTESFLETCDGFRLTRHSLSLPPSMDRVGEDAPWDTNVQAKNLEKLHSYNPTEYGFTENWLQFRNKDGVRYCVRLIEAEFPDLSKLIDVEGPEIHFPDELADALSWAEVMISDALKFDQKVKISFSKTGMLVRGEGPNGWAEKSIRMKYTGQPIEFETHPTFLKEMIGIAKKVIVGPDSLKIEGEGIAHIVSLDEPEK